MNELPSLVRADPIRQLTLASLCVLLFVPGMIVQFLAIAVTGVWVMHTIKPYDEAFVVLVPALFVAVVAGAVADAWYDRTTAVALGAVLLTAYSAFFYRMLYTFWAI